MAAWLKALVIAAIAIFAPVKALMLTTGVLIIADLILGMLAAKKQGNAITSAAMRRTVSKMVIYQVAIMLGFLIEQYMLSGALALSKIIAAAIAMVEGKSCFENLDILNGSPIFADLIKKLGSVNDQPPPPQDPPAA